MSSALWFLDCNAVIQNTLYGLYEGTPLPERDWAYGNVQPDRITIFRDPILEDADGDESVLRAIEETVIHEFGHYFERHCQLNERGPG